MKQPRVLIISPAVANANNGNWQTARRWSCMLRPAFHITVAQAWNGEPFDVMLALHARRSADSIAAWAQAQGVTANARGLGVVLTGTDLYRDIQTDAMAQASLRFAKHLVVLQECGPDALPHTLRLKTRVIFQSAGSRKPVQKTRQHLRAVMVGHLRDEKSPQTLFEAARILKDSPDILIDHIGESLDASLGSQARATAAACPGYRWLGGLSHETTRRHIQRAHLLVHTSRMEGGAHVIMEAVCSGTTGCVEVTRLQFDPSIISLTQILQVFFDIHDPTTLNRQGADVGTQYRSGVYYENAAQAQTARDVIAKIEREQKINIVTEVLPLERYQAAEDYHQDYLANNPRQPYCQMVAAPKLAKARQTFKHLLK